MRNTNDVSSPGESSAERALRELRVELRTMDVDGLDTVRLEEKIRLHLDALGRELIGEVMARANVNDQEVLINNVLHGRVDEHVAKIHTSFGLVETTRTMFRRDGKSPLVSPLDKRLGIVESFYTPKCARILCRLPALLVREDVAAVLGEFGGIGVGAATMHRLPQAVMARYEESRDLIERTVRERSVAEIPPSAVTMQVGLDGEMVPQEGQHCKPRGRASTEREPPRWEQKYGPVTSPGPAANDAHVDRSWHEASVGTLAYFDAEGNHVHTTYLARMPEERKATLAASLDVEVQHALRKRPDLLPILASDGAKAQWATLAEIRAHMPDGPRERATEIIDIFHVTEHLQRAADAIDGQGRPEARVRRAGWAETLKAHADGCERTLQALRHQRRVTRTKTVRETLDSVIGYLAHNKQRMPFKEALERNLPIATGPTEAAAKSLVGVRMKRSGARFSQHGGQTLLTLLAAQKSGRFETLFGVIGATYTAPVRQVA